MDEQYKVDEAVVAEFHKAFDHPIATEPTPGTDELRLLRLRLIAEELCELAMASGFDILVHQTHSMDQPVLSFTRNGERPNRFEMADAIGDIKYVAAGANLVFGFHGPHVIAEIQRANMSKLGANGKPIKDEYGKILKGPYYTPPNIVTALATQPPLKW